MSGKPGTVGGSARIEPITDDDVEQVAQLAALVWRHHYPGIISTAQIEYMLGQRYDPIVLRAELRRQDVWWDQLAVDGAMIAFASYFPAAEAGAMKLDKLYVHPARQRQGAGGMLIAHVCERSRGYGCTRLVLAVNKHNASAIAAYRKHGFSVTGSVIKDIGGGFVMDDYLMEKPLMGDA